jgi:hypothetical protein
MKKISMNSKELKFLLQDMNGLTCKRRPGKEPQGKPG